jgi:hypothetical protein
MKPWQHAKNSVNKWGGKPEDYMHLHDWFDQTKAALPDMRHRAILHSSFGIFLLEQQFGQVMTNSDGRIISVRDVGEDHVVDDLGFIPTIERWLQQLPIEEWMLGSLRGTVRHERRLQSGAASVPDPMDGRRVRPAKRPGQRRVDKTGPQGQGRRSPQKA